MLKNLFSKKCIQCSIYVSGLLLILFFNLEIRSKIRTWKDVNQELTSLYSKANFYFLKKKYNEQFLHPGDFSSILYTLNSMDLLQEEKHMLKEYISHPDFIENKSLKKRWEFISSPISNKMNFSKKNDHQKGVDFFELVNPIELDLSDLDSLLSIIENSYHQKIPYFIFDLEIHRNNTLSKQEVWKLNYKLLKRCI